MLPIQDQRFVNDYDKLAAEWREANEGGGDEQSRDALNVMRSLWHPDTSDHEIQAQATLGNWRWIREYLRKHAGVPGDGLLDPPQHN